MKKYRISAYYVFIYIASLVFFIIPGLLLGIYGLIKKFGWISWIFIFVASISIVCMVYQFLFDFQMGSFMIDESKIIMKVGMRRYEHYWNDFVDFGFVRSYAGNGYLYWVYFSTYDLSYEQRRLFLKKTRRDLKNIAYCKYNESNFDEIMSVIPVVISTKLKEKETEVRDEMTWLEKKYH